MRLNVSLKDFRCFADVGPVRVAPITLLIGENSAGKTSFLAAIRELVEAFNRPFGVTPFNREPYFLGSFEQIAHYRGGRYGRAKTFSFEVEILPNTDQAEKSQSPRRLGRTSRHKLTFRKGEMQPELCRYDLGTRGLTAEFDLSGAKPVFSVRGLDRTEIKLDLGSMPQSLIMRREIAFLKFFLFDVARRVGSEKRAVSDEPEALILRDLDAALRSSSQAMNRSVFASAPVRYQPRRVYTPSELTSQNAGEQVPLQMANLKLSAPARWQLTKARLSAFGRRAGLFDEIDIKRFGKTTSDPFQLQVKTSVLLLTL